MNTSLPVTPEDYDLNGDQEEFLENNDEDDQFTEEVVDPEAVLKADESLWTAESNRASGNSGFSDEAVRAVLANAHQEDARSYVMQESFSPSDLILHSQFGLGIVAKTLSPKKMLVVFEENSRILVMNYTPRGG